jgi:dTDP-glucose 4,6-dehydratase/UDP-glucuronate decarboxylase
VNKHRIDTELYEKARSWLEEDWQRVDAALAEQTARFRGKRILVTGAAGFLGFNFLHYFSHLNGDGSGCLPVRVIAADNYIRGRPSWIAGLLQRDSNITAMRCDITQPWPETSFDCDFIIHGASIASPTYYRKYPLQTLDANISGTRQMLELGRRSKIESILYFSSSEIYGDPPPEEIPTKESYRGNVSCVGPRACYDESKRLGETLCYLYFREFNVPVKIVRPFNNYGPGLRLNDARVLADFCRDVLSGRDIAIKSDGLASRTFCYASDALAGYLLTLLSPYNGQPFNIGSDGPEVNMRETAALVLKAARSNLNVSFEPSCEADYSVDNPQRRCPDISQAKRLLGFAPRVGLDHGLLRLLEWYRQFAALENLSECGVHEGDQ